MTHILIPREPSTALLRPFIGCNSQELHEAWAAMVRIAEVQHARTGSQRPTQIEPPQRPDWLVNALHLAAAAPQAPAAPAEAVTPPVIDERAMKEAFDSATAEGKSFNDALRAAACATIWKRAARSDGAPNAVPAAMSAIATECALHAEERHSYLPNTPAQAATWRPHDWVLQAMSRAISFDRMMNQAAPAAPAVDASTVADMARALEMLVGSDALHSLCEHEGIDAIGRVKGTWSKAAECNARSTLLIHRKAIDAAIAAQAKEGGEAC